MAQENYRVRKIVVMYYLDDDSIFVNEPKIENSGVPQGWFLKRHLIPLPDMSRNYHWTDLNLGINVTMYERTFRIVDCDEFTKKFFEEN